MFWILNGKENSETDAICFGLGIPRKKAKNCHGTIPSKIVGNDVRHLANTMGKMSVFLISTFLLK